MKGRVIRVYTGTPILDYHRNSNKLVVQVENIVIVLELEQILKVLEEHGVHCKCVKD